MIYCACCVAVRQRIVRIYRSIYFSVSKRSGCRSRPAAWRSNVSGKLPYLCFCVASSVVVGKHLLGRLRNSYFTIEVILTLLAVKFDTI